MEKLKALIDANFSTRAEFAEAMNVDPSTLSRMLQNRLWKADKIEQAVKLLGIKPEEIPIYFFPENRTD